MRTRVSVVLPAYNEAESLPEVLAELAGALAAAGIQNEIIVVDDGSTDSTPEVLSRLRSVDPRLRAIRLRRNFGKSVALQAGISSVAGDIVVLMDADGQYCPSEIPTLLGALDGGLDLVTGRRTTREDRFTRRIASRVFNVVTAWFTGVRLHDFNSGMKAMRRSVADGLNLYGELHRYIPVMAHWAGFRAGEIPMQHRARRHGSTKFGTGRLWRGFLDLLTVQLLTRFTARPLHLFGGLGLALGLGGTALLAWMAGLSFMGTPVGNRPALLAGILLVVVAVQLFSIGLLAEFMAHSRGKIDLSQIIEPET